MARIRSVHPGFWTDEAYVSLSPLARLLAIGIWNECDDQGVFEWKPLQLKMRVLPADNVDLSTLLAELETADVVRVFTSGAHKYGAAKNFGQYQRPKKPHHVFPLPDELRTYVAGKKACSEPGEDQGGSSGEEPTPSTDTCSPPVPHRSRLKVVEGGSSSRKSPQMEEGGDKGKGKEDSELRSAAVAAPRSPADELWARGVPYLRSATGMTDGAARGFLGLLRREVREDCAGLLTIFAECEDARPAEPKAWLMAAAKARGGTRQTGIGAKYAEQRARLAAMFGTRDDETRADLLGLPHHGGVQ